MLRLATIVSGRLRSTSGRALVAGAGLAWRAGRAWVVLLAVLTVMSSSVPVAAAWLTKLTLDRIVAGDSVTTLIAMAVALAMAGLLAAVLSHAVRTCGPSWTEPPACLLKTGSTRRSTGYLGWPGSKTRSSWIDCVWRNWRVAALRARW